MSERNFISALSIILLCIVFAPARGSAGVNVDINISAPLPPLPVPAPPPLIPIPGSYAYIAPDVDVDIIFYQGAWYRPHEGRWYRSAEYNGSWMPLRRERVPAALTSLPHDYRRSDHEKIPYGQVKKNWRTWERERRWDKHEKRSRDDGKSEHGRGHGHGRGKHGDD